MSYAKNMICRSVLLTILTSLSSCASTKNAEHAIGYWNVNEDVAYVESHSDGSVGYTVLSSAANVLTGKSYQAVARKASLSIRGCDTWLVLQEVGSYGSDVESRWICNRGDTQSRGVFGVRSGEEYLREVADGAQSGEFEDLLSRLRAAKPLDYSRFTTLDARTLFVTFYDREIVRRALYSPLDLNSSEDKSAPNAEPSAGDFDWAYRKLLSDFYWGK